MIDQDKLDELLDQWEAERERGQELSPDDLCSNCPEMVEIVTSQIHALKATDWLMESDDEDDDFLSLPPELSQGLFAVPASVSLEQFTSRLISSRLLTEDDMPRFSAENAQELGFFRDFSAAEEQWVSSQGPGSRRRCPTCRGPGSRKTRMESLRDQSIASQHSLPALVAPCLLTHCRGAVTWLSH